MLLRYLSALARRQTLRPNIWKFRKLIRCKFQVLAAALLAFLAATGAPRATQAGECPTSESAIATDRPDVTNSSLVVPLGSLQSENGINTTGRGSEKTFDGSNSRLRLGVASCLEILVDLPNFTDGLKGNAGSGFSNVVPAVKWQLSSLPEKWNLSVTAGAGLPTGASKVVGPGIQPYLQFPWSHELGDGWGTSGMVTTFFFPSDPTNRLTTEATFALEKKITSVRLSSSSMLVTMLPVAAVQTSSTQAAAIC